MLAHQGLVADLDLVARVGGLAECRAAMEEAHLVLLEQVQDAVVVLLHDGVLASEHPGDVDPEVLHRDAVVAEVLRRFLVVLRGLQQRLGRDAAHVGAGAARGRPARLVLPLVDARGVETELRRADGGDVAARAAADDDDVEL